MEPTKIKPHDLEQLRGAKPALLLDVRTPAEFNELRADGARLMPLDKLDAEAVRSACRSGEPVYVLCRTGGRATTAAKKLSAAGVNAVVVEGGTLAWEAAGLPVKRGRKVMSIERQVRIGAGTLVVLGVLLGWLLHPAWLLLSAFVGCGLVFAGVTDICGMAFVLGKMPWNQAYVHPAEMLCPPTPRGTAAAAPTSN
jgi:rhodanese-related sulfurtransferase